MVSIKAKNDNNRPKSNGTLRCVSDPRVRTRKAALEAARLAESLLRGKGETTPGDDGALFRALHTCAYRATRRIRSKHGAAKERKTWVKRWKIIRDRIVERNMGLVWCMIGQFGSASLDREEQGSVATIALLKAIDGFNPWLGFRFSTYACNAIRRSLVLLARSHSRTRIRLPLEEGVFTEQPESVDTGLELYADRLGRLLDKNLGDLTDREAKVVAWRFPMDGSPGLTLGEVGHVMGLSKERVRQIQKKALDKLRRVLEADPLLQ